MSWSRIMFAVASPGGVGAMEMDKAARLAAALECELELFHCMFDPQVARPGRYGTRGAQEDIHQVAVLRRQQLEYNAMRLRTRGVRLQTSVRWDSPVYQGIVRQVLRHKPRLLIVQSNRRGRMERLLRRQTDFRLIETCPCPVLFLNSGRPWSDPTIVAGVDPERSHRKAAALDDQILAAATGLSRALHGRLRVFHARSSWEHAVRTYPQLREVPAVELGDAQAAYRKRVDAVVLELARRHEIAADCVQVIEGDAADLLPRITSGGAADVVVLGLAPRSRFGRALIGHTAERVLDTLDCDVMIVKGPGFRTPVRRGATHHVVTSAAEPGRIIL